MQLNFNGSSNGWRKRSLSVFFLITQMLRLSRLAFGTANCRPQIRQNADCVDDLTDEMEKVPLLLTGPFCVNVTKRRLRLSLTTCFCLFLVPSFNVLAGKFPDFEAECLVSTKIFPMPGPQPAFQAEAQAHFIYSNGLWEIDYTTIPTNSASGTVSCRRITDGIRWVAAAKNSQEMLDRDKIFTLANAVPIPCPPAELTEALACWLMLCPNPDLPIIKSNRIKRFYPSKFWDNPKNEGTFTAHYLAPEEIFLSELSITDNGFDVSSQPVRHDKPFDEGLTEFRFRVTTTTNFLGVSIPLTAIMERMLPLPAAKTTNDVYSGSITIIKVLNLTTTMLSKPSVPSKMIAADTRPPNLPDNAKVSYLVTNDSWVSVTNRQLRRIAENYRRQAHAKTDSTRKRLPIIAAFVIITILPISFLTLKKIKTIQQKKKNNV